MHKIRKYISIIIKTTKLLCKSSVFFFAFNIFFSFAQGLFIPLNIYIWKNVIDGITKMLLTKSTDFSIIIIWLIFYFLIFLLSNIISNLSQYIQVIYSEYLSKYISNLIISKSLELEMKDYDNYEIYNTLNKASSQSSNRSLQILQTFLQLIQNITSLIGVFIMLLSFAYYIVILCIVATIPMFYINCRIMDQLFEIFNRRVEKLRYADTIKELLIQNNNIKEIKVFNIGLFLKDKIINILDKNIKEDKDIRGKILLKNSIATFFDNILVIGVKLLVIYLSIKRSLSIGLVTMYISSVDTLKNSVQNTLSLLSSSYEHSLYMDSIFSILQIKSTTNDKGKIIDRIDEIRFHNVSFKYPYTDQYILKNINVTFKSNQSTALVGLNGAGKTTLIKLILNLYEPTDGKIYINNINMKDLNKDVYFSHVSAVFQDFIKYPFDIKTNIGVGNIEKMKEIDLIKKASKFSGIDTFVESLPKKYDTLLQKGWQNSIDISLGQWQKISISRAMMRRSDLIILDEPTASLDAEAENDIFYKFKQMQKEKISILVSHRFSSLLLADRIIVISDNTILETGTHSELMKNGKEYKRLYELQFNMYK